MMRTFITFVFIAPLLCLCIQACKKPGCVGKAGNIITSERILPAFSRIALEDNIDVVLVQSDTEKLQITGPENILPNIQTIINNNELVISNDTECRWLRDASERITVKLYFKDLTYIDYRGSGDVSNEDTLHLNTLGISSETGAGNIELTIDNNLIVPTIVKENASIILHGFSFFCSSYINARGTLDLSDLNVNEMQIVYSGLADTYMKVSGKLDATIRYKGNIHYKGNPNIVRSDYFSSGRLIPWP